MRLYTALKKLQNFKNEKLIQALRKVTRGKQIEELDFEEKDIDDDAFKKAADFGPNETDYFDSDEEEGYPRHTSDRDDFDLDDE
jgi:hypothetical protein